MEIDLNELRTEEIQLKPLEFLPAVPEKHYVPSVRLSVCDAAGNVEYGLCYIRIGRNAQVKYAGNIGYEIHEAHRGHGYAAKACVLLYKLAARFGMDYVTMTCAVDNKASIRTLENSGAVFTRELSVPEWHDLRDEGMERVLEYRVDFPVLNRF